MQYFQDMLEGNHCFGCGPENEGGLRLKSYWASEEETQCDFQPQAHHCAAPTKFLNGGIIATVMDCHSICTAIAHAYKRVGRDVGEGEPIWYATAGLELSYLKPTPIDAPVKLRAWVTGETENTIDLRCLLEAGDKECVTAKVVAAYVPLAWITSQK